MILTLALLCFRSSVLTNRGTTSIDRRAFRYFAGGARTVLAAWALLGCGRHARPWEGPPDGGVADESRPFLPPVEGGKSLLPAASGSAEATAVAPGPKAPRAGGLWRSCAVGFRAGDEPKKDAERLARLCGPENGMKRDTAWDGPATAEPDRHPMRVRAGFCYRVFAVGDPGVGDLDVAIVSARQSRLAEDDSDDRVVMVEPERPFCSFADDDLIVEIRANRGHGRYAAQIYQLPATR